MTLQKSNLFFLTVTSVLLIGAACAQMPSKPSVPKEPWLNATLSPDERAELVLKQLTLDEKISLLHGTGSMGYGAHSPEEKDSNGGAGYVVGIPRLGIPGIQMADAAYGVTRGEESGRYSTALPANVGAAASWDLKAAYEYGALIGRELRAHGYNMSLGGGVNITREPRNGRTFEYLGEDPILAGYMVGEVMKGLQAQHVIGDIKHYALNDQESGRNAVNVNIDERSMRESDLLSFEIGLRISNAGGVMCSYNRVNGDFACENKYLLTNVLRKDWNFKGFVLSDWGGTHSTVKASAAGLDNEEPSQIFYGEPMKKAVQSGEVSMAELDEHVRRILRTEFATGIVDYPVQRSVVDVVAGFEIAQDIAEQSIVLLKNEHATLPLDTSKLRSIAVIGAHADIGMISGGGSAQVDPPGGNAIMPPGQGRSAWMANMWFPTSPLKAIRAKAPGTDIEFESGDDPDAAVALAKKSDFAIVFAYQWESEGMDLKNLSLPGKQDELIGAVAAANPRTIVVLETGGPVLMPWADKVDGIVEAWYAGSRGAEAVTNVLVGQVNPSAKLPLTFPKSESDLPHPSIVKPPPTSTAEHYKSEAAKMESAGLPAFQITYDEGLKVGYKWYDAESKPVLFPFGYGLSYTTFSYSGLKVNPASPLSVRFTIRNTGKRAGAEIAEVYAALPKSAAEPPKRLVGWSKVQLEAGESKEVSVKVDPQFLSIFNTAKHGWELVPGEYGMMVGGSSQDLPLKATISLK